MPKIKCTRCKFAGEQCEFPHKPDLQYYKTCKSCTEKKARQQQEKQANKPKRPAPGKDTTPSGLPEIAWDIFLTLLADNKTHVFDLHTFVSLDREHPALETELNGSSHDLSMCIARDVWSATGFRFKYVTSGLMRLIAYL